MKQILSLLFALCLMLCLFSGCKTSSEEAKAQKNAQEMIQTAQQDGSLQPGATVTTGRDEQGNATFHYTNPDGTSGGGATIN